MKNKLYLFFTLMLLLPGCSSKPHIVEPVTIDLSPGKNPVYVTSHGWHTGFVIASAQAEATMPFLKERFSSPKYYEFGWGDKGFYQAQEITSGLTLQAIFWPTDSVMHVVAVPYDPKSYFENGEVIGFSLNDSELKNLLTFINRSFYHTRDGKVVIEKKGLYGDSQFYTGEGDYYLFNTCNKWTAKGLASAGFDISTTFKLTAESIMSYLRDHVINTSTTPASNLNNMHLICS